MKRLHILFGILLFSLLASAQTMTLTFRNTPLPEALRRIDQSQTDKTINFFYDELEKYRVTKSIKNLTALDAVRTLCAGLPIKVKTKRNDIFVVPGEKLKSPTGRPINLIGTIRDLFTDNGIDSVSVQILNSDGVLIANTLAEIPLVTEKMSESTYMTWKDPKNGSRFEVFVPKGTYKIRCTKLGYEMAQKDLTLPDAMRGKQFDMGDIYMQELNRQMQEVVITVTKIKMFYKGDTLVYNADAFLMPDGSMLKDLVRQLPGAEIRDGNVYVNGRLVENLLLGGKDFFNGNPQAALRNLPAYVVSRVKFYEKEGEQSQTTGTDMGDKLYVMDVHLKRQYIGTTLGQLQTGGGTAVRYDAGLFAMRFDDRQSFTITGDFNNLNTENEYTELCTMSRVHPSGDHTRHNAAADYRYEPNGRLKLTANATFDHGIDRLMQGTASETFLSGGNTFGHSLLNRRDRNIGVNGNTKLSLRPRKGRFYELGYKGGYKHTDHRSDLRSSSFDALDSLALNRLQNDARAEGDNSFHRATAHASQAFKGDLLDLTGEFGYENYSENRFDLYSLEYPKHGLSSDFRNRFADRKSESRNYKLQGKYFWKYRNTTSANGQLVFGYTFAQNHATERNPLYRLDWLGGEWAAIETAQMGVLPSATDELLRTADIDNSYSSTSRISCHTASLDWSHDRQLPSKGWLEMNAVLRMNIKDARLDYDRFGRTFHADRQALLPAPSASLYWRPLAGDKNGTKMSLRLQYDGTAAQPSLRYLLNLTDAADPLAVTVGNPNLKNMRSDKLSLQFSRNWQHGRSLSTSADWQRWHNQVAVEQTYDRESGVRTSRWVNVDGNWLANYDLWGSLNLDKDGKLSFQFHLKTSCLHSTDLSFNQGEERTISSTVGTLTITPNFSLCYRPNSDNYLSGGVYLNWRNANGDRPDFVPVNTTDVAYHLNGCATLPGQIIFDTNLQVISRYGLTDVALNDTRIVCNASLSKSIKSFTLNLQAFDLFGRNRYTTVNINSQGRTETWANTLPRHFLLSLMWKFNKVGKKNDL